MDAHRGVGSLTSLKQLMLCNGNSRSILYRPGKPAALAG
jgi:hypothetical protein